jgi:hypothetical protein
VPPDTEQSPRERQLRIQNAQLRRELEAIRLARELLPLEYALALQFAHFATYGSPVTSQETPGRQHPESRAPGHNAAVYKVLKDEQRELRKRARVLTSATDWAIAHPNPSRRAKRTA